MRHGAATTFATTAATQCLQTNCVTRQNRSMAIIVLRVTSRSRGSCLHHCPNMNITNVETHNVRTQRIWREKNPTPQMKHTSINEMQCSEHTWTGCSNQLNWVLMNGCNTVISPLLTQWGYYSTAQSHQYSYEYCQTSNINCNKSQNLYDSCLVL